RLADALEAHGVDVWLDQTRLRPGDRWKNVIRREISQGDFFIACFSVEYHKRHQSFMNEEITQAIEKLRRLPPNHPWLIPVLLSECEVPDFSIGAGETLDSFHYIALYQDWKGGIRRLLDVIQPHEDAWHSVKLYLWEVQYSARLAADWLKMQDPSLQKCIER